MYHLCLLEPALFRFLHDAPRSELLIDLLLNFFMTLRGHLVSEAEYYNRAGQAGSQNGDQNPDRTPFNLMEIREGGKRNLPLRLSFFSYL